MPLTRPKKRPSPFHVFLGALFAAALACLAIVYVIAVATKEPQSQSPATYYEASDTAPVTWQTVISLHDEHDQVLQEYDLIAEDSTGMVRVHHVDDGEFTCAQTGFDVDTLSSMIVRDDNGVIHDMPRFDIIENPESAIVSVNVRYDAQSPDTLSDERRSAYAAYYDKISQLQTQYGTTRTLREYTDILEGFCLTFLRDFNADGIEELVTVTSGDATDGSTARPGKYLVKVWEYDADSNRLSEVFSGDPGFRDAGISYVEIRESDDGETIMYASGYETGLGNYTIFHYSNGKPETLQYERYDVSSDSWYLNGAPISLEQKREMGAKYSSYKSSTIYTLSYPRTDMGANSPINQTIQSREDTIALLQEGMINGFDER